MHFNLHFFLIFILIALFRFTFALEERQPMYKYRYETEDMMKTSASSYPVRGYHVVEGGYYPQDSGMDRGFRRTLGGYVHDGFASGDRFSGGGPYGDSSFSSGRPISGEQFGSSISGRIGGSIGGSQYRGLNDFGYNAGLGSSGVRFPDRGINDGYYLPNRKPHFRGIHTSGPIGGEYVDQNYYEDDHRRHNDRKYENSNSKSGVESNQEGEGYKQDKVALKDSKGDAGYYSDGQGVKKVLEDGKHYNGAEKFNEQGNNGAERKEKTGHKKGHVIKGFKTSHHKDESGKTEEYYDEEHDEGNNMEFDGRSGNFAQKKENGFKGSHVNDQYGSDEQRKQGHYDNVKEIKNDNADKGLYGQKKYFGKGQVFGLNNGIDAQSLLVRQEQNRFQKEHPYNVPIYSY